MTVRPIRRAILGLAVGLAAVAGIGFLAYSVLVHRLPAFVPDSVPLSASAPFRSWEEHDAIYRAAEFPYTVRVDDARSGGAVLYLGVLHSTDPAHAQWGRIRKQWTDFRPTVALNEGRSKVFRFASTSIGGISDPKLAYVLARRDGIPIYSLEPTYETEVQGLLAHWTPELVAAYLTIRVYVTEASGRTGDLDALASSLLRKRTSTSHLRDSLDSVEALDELWARELPSERDWRTLRTTEEVPLLRRIGDDAREIRGKHMVGSLVTLASRGERVVAVVGASHVIRHEPTLRGLLSDRLQ